jgi:hypothetical protein
MATPDLLRLDRALSDDEKELTSGKSPDSDEKSPDSEPNPPRKNPIRP